MSSTSTTSGASSSEFTSRKYQWPICPWPLPNQRNLPAIHYTHPKAEDRKNQKLHPALASSYQYASEKDPFTKEMQEIVERVADLFQRRRKNTEEIEKWLKKSPTKSAKQEAKRLKFIRIDEEASFLADIIESMD